MPIGFLEAFYQDMTQRIERYYDRKSQNYDSTSTHTLIIQHIKLHGGVLYGSDFSRRWNLNYPQIIELLKNHVIDGNSLEFSEVFPVTGITGRFPDSVYCSSWGSLYELINNGYLKRIIKAGTIKFILK
jgi:hypothetical protein